MSTEPAISALFRGLVDDAALFPPGNAPMDVAVAEHRRHRAAPYADFVGPFLCPVARWDELVAELGDGHPPLDLGLIGAAEPLLATIARASAEPRVRLARLECPVPAADPVAGVAATAALLDPAVDESVEIFLELARGAGLPAAVDAAAATGTDHFIGAKLRTGGADAAAFPGDAELAGFVTRCLAADHPFKLTAGLHRAIRHTDPVTGFEHHGYLNVLAATCLGWWPESPPLADVATAIATRDADPLVRVARAMADQPGEASESRTWFWSYGSCSVAEPLADLAALGLLDADLLTHLPERDHA